MNKTIRLIIMACTLIMASNAALAMDDLPSPKELPLLNVQGHLIPSQYTLLLAPSSLFSAVGAFIACLGGLLIYQGIQKEFPQSQSTTSQAHTHAQPEEAIEKESLIKKGSLLILAGALAIFHRSLLGL